MNDAAPPVFRLPEVVRHGNAAAVRLDGEQSLEQAQGAVAISLGALKESNSVVVALLLAWVRYARARGKSVRFVDVPGDLRNIIELYGVAGILPLDGGGSGSAWSLVNDSDAQVSAMDAADSEQP